MTQTVGEGISGNLSLKFSNVGTTNVNDRLWLDNISNVSVVPAGSGGPVAGSYADWASKNSVTGEASDDSNHDGVPNGIAYFMGVTGLATLPGPDASGTVAWPMSATFSGTHVVETSTDLVTWTSVSTQPTPAGGYLSYTLPKDAVGGKQFVRLVVTPN